MNNVNKSIIIPNTKTQPPISADKSYSFYGTQGGIGTFLRKITSSYTLLFYADFKNYVPISADEVFFKMDSIWADTSSVGGAGYLFTYFTDIIGGGSASVSRKLRDMTSRFIAYQYNHQTREFIIRTIVLDSGGNLLFVGADTLSYKRRSAAPSFSTIELSNTTVKSYIPIYTINIFDKLLTDQELAHWYKMVKRRYR